MVSAEKALKSAAIRFKICEEKKKQEMKIPNGPHFKHSNVLNANFDNK